MDVLLIGCHVLERARVPAFFVALCERAALHADPNRFGLLYRLLWRLVHEPALKAYEERLKLASQEGIDISQAAFSAGFGRAFEYYTGFVFEILSPALGDTTPIGGGGRYDTLVKAISGSLSVPAVGAALHTERLLLAVRGGRP